MYVSTCHIIRHSVESRRCIPSHVGPCDYFAPGRALPQLHRIRDVGIRAKGFDHGVSPFLDLQHVVIHELGFDVVLLQCYVSKAEEAVGNSEFVNCLSQNVVIVS